MLGFLWVLLSILWRFPFLIGGGFDLGLTMGSVWSLEDNQFYVNLLNNYFMIAVMLSGAIILFFFFNFQEKYHRPIFDSQYDDTIGSDLELPSIGKINLYALLNIISVIFLLLGSNLGIRDMESLETYGNRTNGIFLFAGIFLKASIIPILAIMVCWKFISLRNTDKPSKGEISLEKKNSELSLFDQI